MKKLLVSDPLSSDHCSQQMKDLSPLLHISAFQIKQTNPLYKKKSRGERQNAHKVPISVAPPISSVLCLAHCGWQYGPPARSKSLFFLHLFLHLVPS